MVRLRIFRPGKGVEDWYLPHDPLDWPDPTTLPKLSGVELIGFAPTPELINKAQTLGWIYNSWDGRFYPA
jgi:hypothetical protein